jgi:hypothetical protein
MSSEYLFIQTEQTQTQLFILSACRVYLLVRIYFSEKLKQRSLMTIRSLQIPKPIKIDN